MPEHLPDWVPQLVRKRACELLAEYANKPEERASVLKLATDPRMKKVWSYLLRIKRDSDKPLEYLNPVIDQEPDCGVVREGFTTRAEWMQHVGMKALFDMILLKVLPGRLDWNALRSELPVEQTIAHFRAALQGLDEIGPLPVKATELRLGARRDLLRAMEKLERIKILDRVTPGQVRAGMLASLARNFTQVFGTPMYGLVATVANVILDGPVKPDQVREAVEGPWGMRGRKVRPKPRDQS